MTALIISEQGQSEKGITVYIINIHFGTRVVRRKESTFMNIFLNHCQRQIFFKKLFVARPMNDRITQPSYLLFSTTGAREKA